MTAFTLDLDGMERKVLAALCEHLKCPVENINLDDSFIALGLDSLAAVFLCGSLEEQLNCTIDPVLVFDAASVKDFARLVHQECKC